jgi:hypothetical protein
MVPVHVLLAVVIVLFVGLLFLLDRVVKVTKRGLRRREANLRLAAAAAEAEEKDKQRRAEADESGALTSVMPAIHEHDPRTVD